MEKFSKEYNIRTYECDKNSHLRILTLMNILQDMADSHATDLNLGLEFCLANGLAWVGSNYQVRIKRLPGLHETIKVVTWPAEEKKIGAVRDFIVYDEAGEVIIVASSQWILIDFARRRPVSLRAHLPEYTVIAERSLPTTFEKLPEPERVDMVKTFAVRFDDIDINNHVNNAVYPLWATEAVPMALRETHFPAEIEIAFKKEGHLGEDVEIATQIDGIVTLHVIKALSDDRELARLRINWQKI